MDISNNQKNRVSHF